MRDTSFFAPVKWAWHHVPTGLKEAFNEFWQDQKDSKQERVLLAVAVGYVLLRVYVEFN